MPRRLIIILAIVGAAFLPFTWTRSAPIQSGAGPAANSLSFRLTFGNLQLRPNDYSGSIELTAGQNDGNHALAFARRRRH